MPGAWLPSPGGALETSMFMEILSEMQVPIPRPWRGRSLHSDTRPGHTESAGPRPPRGQQDSGMCVCAQHGPETCLLGKEAFPEKKTHIVNPTRPGHLTRALRKPPRKRRRP